MLPFAECPPAQQRWNPLLPDRCSLSESHATNHLGVGAAKVNHNLTGPVCILRRTACGRAEEGTVAQKHPREQKIDGRTSETVWLSSPDYLKPDCIPSVCAQAIVRRFCKAQLWHQTSSHPQPPYLRRGKGCGSDTEMSSSSNPCAENQIWP